MRSPTLKRARKKGSSRNRIGELKRLREYRQRIEAQENSVEPDMITDNEELKSDILPDEQIKDEEFITDTDENLTPEDTESKTAVQNEHHRKVKKSKKKSSIGKKLLILMVSSLTIILGFFVVLGLGGFFSGNEEYMAPVDKATGKVNVLLLGVDKDGLRTDTIIIASYDTDENKVNMLSIPRDTRMYIGNRYQKINAAHAISQDGKLKGIKGTIEAVSRLTQIPINYYVEFSFDAFRETIDALDGVDFDVPRDMYYKDPTQDLYINLKKGFQHLDGDKAEQLVRFRQYVNGDIDRVAVQQDFIKAVAEQKLNISILGNIPDLYDVLKDEVKTNFTLSDLLMYANNLKELSPENINMFQVPGDFSGDEYRESYWLVNIPELKTLIETIFGYDAENATIHSADGSSISKDKPDIKPATPAPSESPEPSSTPTATSSPKPSTSPKPTATIKPTEKPTNTPATTPSSTIKPTAKPTEKPTERPARPTAKPAD